MFKFWELLSQDTRNGMVWMPVLAFSIALVASSIAWPLVYYHTTRNQQMIEGGYEEVADPRSSNNVLWVKKRDDK